MTATTTIYASRIIIGPLTTTFTPASSCLVPTAGIGDLATGAFAGYAAQTCVTNPITANGVPETLYDASTCWPPASPGLPTPRPRYFGWGFYSPGLICPSGYTSACTATAGGQSQWSVEFSMLAGETAVGCCPSGYTCTTQNVNTGGVVQSCIRHAGYYNSFPLATCSSGSLVGLTTLTLPYTFSATATNGAQTTAQVASFDLWNPMIEIRWKSSDLPVSNTSTSTASTTSPTSMSTTSSTSHTATSSATTHASSGLSRGAQAGIGVGVAAAVLLLLGLGFFIRSTRKQSIIHTEPRDDNEGGEPIDTKPPDEPPHPPIMEMEASEMAPVEKDATASAIPELSSSTAMERCELPGDSR